MFNEWWNARYETEYVPYTILAYVIMAAISAVILAAQKYLEKRRMARKAATDCASCWCNTCEMLEDCDMHRFGVEPRKYPLRPKPCAGCKQGMQFMAGGKQAPCLDYRAKGT